MSQEDFEIKINVPMIKELVSDKIYRSDASAFREQYVNALSHGCIAYHQEYGYKDDVFVHVLFDYGMRKVTITDNGMGMNKSIFSDNFMSFGFSTVGKDKNNTRSGMFGLGAISFFRIAGACVVESWDRKTNERFCFMTRSTDESEFVANRTLEGPGTKTEITLKEHVRMSSLVEMVKIIASNYPVRTVLEIVNSESEQTISTYNTNDRDSYEDFAPIMRFKDYVSKRTDGKFVTLIDNDELELYLSTTGGNKNHSYLCRIPIDIRYSTGFTTYLNMKKEKIKGTDKNGKEKLQEIPKPDRDEVNEIASEYFSELIEKKCDEMIYAIDIKNFEEYQESKERWILNGYSVDDKLNTQTHSFIQKMREPVRYRTENGIQKRNSTLLTLFGEYETVMFHPSLHKGTFDAIEKHLKTAALQKFESENVVEDTDEPKPQMEWNNKFILVDDHCGQPLQDAKEYKKKFKVKSVVTSGSGNGASRGLLVRDGSWNNFRLTNQSIEEALELYPGGLYYADGLVKQNEMTSNVDTGNSTDWYNSNLRRNKSGIIIAQKAKKIYPSITKLYDEIIDAASKGNIKYMKRVKDYSEANVRASGKLHTKIVDVNFDEGIESVESDENKKQLRYRNMKYFIEHEINYVTILPLACAKSLDMLKYLENEFVFVPTRLMHSMSLMKRGWTDNKILPVIKLLRHIPEWTQWSQRTSATVWKKYNLLLRRYNSTDNVNFYVDIIRYMAAIEEGHITKPDEDTYMKKMGNILDEHDESWHRYNLEYNKMFPSLHLESRAKELGWSDTEVVEDKDGIPTVNAYTRVVDGMMPMEIGGVKYAVQVNEHDEWKAVIDDEGRPQLVRKLNSNETWPIVEHDGQLKFKREMDQYD